MVSIRAVPFNLAVILYSLSEIFMSSSGPPDRITATLFSPSALFTSNSIAWLLFLM